MGHAYELESARDLPAFTPAADGLFTAATCSVTVSVPRLPGPGLGFVRLVRR